MTQFSIENWVAYPQCHNGAAPGVLKDRRVTEQANDTKLPRVFYRKLATQNGEPGARVQAERWGAAITISGCDGYSMQRLYATANFSFL